MVRVHIYVDDFEVAPWGPRVLLPTRKKDITFSYAFSTMKFLQV